MAAGVQHAKGEYGANTGLLHPYSMVTASCNNNQLRVRIHEQMEHSQKALLPPLQLSSLLTMKGGNLSQLNDYAMTHPACGECKHCEMQEEDQGNLYLSTIFSSGYKYADFFRWHDLSTMYWSGYDLLVTGLKDGFWWFQRTGGSPGIWNLFPTQV